MYVITVDDKIVTNSSGNVISTREGTVIHATGSDNQQFLAITAGLTLEHNKSGSLSLTLPPTNYALRMGLLKKLKPIIRIYKDFVRHDNLVWKGRILDSSRDFIGRVTFRCEGWLSVLCDSIVFPTQGLEDNEKISKSPQQMFLDLIASHNAQMGDGSGKQFNVHTYGFPGGDVDEVMAAATHNPLSVGSTGDEVTLLQTYLNKLGFTCAVDGIFGYETKNAVVAYQESKGLAQDGIVGDYTWEALDADMSTETPYVASSVEFPNGSYETTLDYIEQNLIQNLEVGGSIWVEENDIYFYAPGYEPYASQDIVFGENLLDFTEFIDASEVYTVLYPVGKDDLTLSGGFVEAPDAINLFGRIIRKEDFSDAEDTNTLETNARRMLADNIKANTSIEISAFDLAILNRDESAFKVGENVRVTSPPHNLDAYYLCTAINMDLCDPSKNTYTLGISPETLTDRLANAQNQITTTTGSIGRIEPREGEFLGVDVSEHNGDIYWPAAVGVLDVAIIRVCTINRAEGNGLYDVVDPYFVQNYTGATNNGIAVGVYAFIGGNTVEQVRHEAETVVGILQANNCRLNLPVWFDMESTKYESMGEVTIRNMINAFKEVVVNAGYLFGIYTNRNWWTYLLPDDIKSNNVFWIAAFPSTEYDNGTIKESLRPSYGVGWQYSGYGMKTGRLAGFQNPSWMLDMDIFYQIWPTTPSQ